MAEPVRILSIDGGWYSRDYSYNGTSGHSGENESIRRLSHNCGYFNGRNNRVRCFKAESSSVYLHFCHWALLNYLPFPGRTQEDQNSTLAPTKEWVKDLVDQIIAEEFASPDLELAWLDEDKTDPKTLKTALESRVKLGAMTLNETRDALGLYP